MHGPGHELYMYPWVVTHRLLSYSWTWLAGTSAFPVWVWDAGSANVAHHLCARANVWCAKGGARWHFRKTHGPHEWQWHECALCWMCDFGLHPGPGKDLIGSKFKWQPMQALWISSYWMWMQIIAKIHWNQLSSKRWFIASEKIRGMKNILKLSTN